MVLSNSINKSVRWLTVEAGMTIHNQRKATFHSSSMCNSGVCEVSVCVGVVRRLSWWQCSMCNWEPCAIYLLFPAQLLVSLCPMPAARAQLPFQQGHSRLSALVASAQCARPDTYLLFDSQHSLQLRLDYNFTLLSFIFMFLWLFFSLLILSIYFSFIFTVAK